MTVETSAPATMTAQELIALAQNYAKAVCISDIRTVNSFHAENSITASGQEPGNPMSMNERQRYFEERQWAFPDFHFEATNVRAHPKKGIVTFEWTVTGTFKKPFKGLPPNGRRITQKGTTELEIVNGKIVRETSFQDRDSFMKQLKAPRGSKKYE